MILDIDHPGHGLIRLPFFPIKLSGTPCRVRRSAPDLGAHADAILAVLGYEASDREAWRRDGVI
jgi:CoA:oxalate CoA-transferase